MKVWQLMEKLSRQPAGADVMVTENQNNEMEPLEIAFFTEAEDAESNCYIQYRVLA